jgi:hypothetical protein
MTTLERGIVVTEQRMLEVSHMMNDISNGKWMPKGRKVFCTVKRSTLQKVARVWQTVRRQ